MSGFQFLKTRIQSLRTFGFPKIRGTPLRLPLIRILAFGGHVGGPPISGKLPLMVCPKLQAINVPGIAWHYWREKVLAGLTP